GRRGAGRGRRPLCRGALAGVVPFTVAPIGVSDELVFPSIHYAIFLAKNEHPSNKPFAALVKNGSLKHNRA
ncbi:hypothetical protein PYR67_33535, partial [Rhizobium sp. BC49]|nr:hypothetical protein [Rhizobium sp. BC49]